MPKLYEYFGIIILFYSNDHEPIHVHGKYQEKESKAEIVIVDGEIKEIIIGDVKGKKPLDRKELTSFKKVVEHYKDDIVRKWIDFFILNKHVRPEKINREIN